MPRYILSIIQPDGPAPSPEFLAPILKDLSAVNADMTAAGVRVMAAGLKPSAEAFVVRGGRGAVAVTDGPFAESKEHIGGFTLIEVMGPEQARYWATRLHEAITLPIEVRELVEAGG
ncbi:MAG TPA: YciI family protein [Caulobacter sp.]|nr:YciI family protein [Caulobacter sp.]